MNCIIVLMGTCLMRSILDLSTFSKKTYFLSYFNSCYYYTSCFSREIIDNTNNCKFSYMRINIFKCSFIKPVLPHPFLSVKFSSYIFYPTMITYLYFAGSKDVDSYSCCILYNVVTVQICCCLQLL